MADFLSTTAAVLDAVSGVLGTVEGRASFRGVPFGLLGSKMRPGRRVALHEYPNRDTAWPEDMGKANRPFEIAGFLIDNSAAYGGGPIELQRAQMEAAANAKGPGTLVLPNRGALQVSLLDAEISERWDEQLYYELRFAFVMAGARLYPSSAITTGSQTADAVLAAVAAIGNAFSAGMSAVSPTPSVVAAVSAGAAGFLSLGSSLNVSGQPGFSAAASALSVAAGGYGPAGTAAALAAAAQTFAGQVRTSTPSPTDALRVATQLAGGNL
jgi:prophage DNA circulation protein